MKHHLQGIDTIIVRVSDIAKAKQWYTGTLGLSIEWEDLILKLIVLNTGGPTSLTVWQTEEAVTVAKEGSAYPIFRTQDAAAAQAAMVAAGIVTDAVITDHAVTYFRFYDPDGNILEACQVH